MRLDFPITEVPKCHEPILRLHLGETFLVLANEDGVGRCESL